MMRAADIASSIGPNWPAILVQLGIDAQYLSNKHGPCPVCGGKDRFRFDNRHGRGGFYCNGCGAGDGFTLLQRLHGWDFKTAREQVMKAAGLKGERLAIAPKPIPDSPRARPTGRVLKLKREACAIADCTDALEYLRSRRLWPIAARTSLRAHAGLDYFEDGRKIGRFPALLAAVRDVDGDLVTIHTTYLQAGRKLAAYEPRKLLSPVHGRDGCAVRLQRISGDTMGLGEGIETCLAAAHIHGVPVWAALNTSLLAKFIPPAPVKHLIIMADADAPGQQAAATLMQRLEGRVELEIRTPPPPAKDWNEIGHHE